MNPHSPTLQPLHPFRRHRPRPPLDHIITPVLGPRLAPRSSPSLSPAATFRRRCVDESCRHCVVLGACCVRVCARARKRMSEMVVSDFQRFSVIAGLEVGVILCAGACILAVGLVH
jgi:hypothetical protein